mgnify:CR=1 FL=1
MIRCSQPSITQKEKDFIVDAVNHNDIGVGPYVKKFEDAWASYNGMQFGVACNSGTNAIYLALLALGIGKGDEVIVPSYTMVATAWAVSYTGAKPVFIDCRDDLNIDVSLIEDAISKKTKAIIPVHIYGRQCDMIEINKIAKAHDLYVVEDMAEAHGIIPDGDIACYSFYGNKILTTGEGGMCITNNGKWAHEIKLFANMYMDSMRSMLHMKTAYNFRMTNIQAAIGYAQALRADELIEKRQLIQSLYTKYLNKKYLMPNRNVVWMYDIDCGDKQELIKQKLAEEGIETRYGFKPMEMQPMYFYKNYKLLNSYKWSKRILYLPTYPDLTEKDIIRICDIINNI